MIDKEKKEKKKKKSTVYAISEGHTSSAYS